MSLHCNGTSQGAVSSGPLTKLAGLSRIGIAFLIKTTFAADDDILFEYSANSNSNDGTFKCIANESGLNKFFFDWNSPVATKSYMACTSPADNVWTRVICEVDMSQTAVEEARRIFIGGTAQTLTTNPFDNVGTFTSQLLYLMCRAGTGLWADGDMSDFGIFTGPSDPGDTIYPTMFSPADVAALSTGRCNKAGVQLLYHWRLSTDLVASVGGVDLTGIGTPTFTADPPAIAIVPGDLIIARS